MGMETSRTQKSWVIGAEHLSQLIAAIAKRGYQLFGPVIREGAIVYDRLHSAEDLPRGWKDEQEAGKYRLERRTDQAYFGYNAGPHSWKKFLHPPVQHLWTCTQDGGGFHLVPEVPAAVKRAFIGVRPCELRAIAVMDKVLAGGTYVDPAYKTNRENLLIIAVNCAQAAGTCFCASVKAGPQAVSGYDLALTEMLEAQRHDFLLEVGTAQGSELVQELPYREASANDLELAEQILSETRAHMGRTLEVAGLQELLYRNYENPRWDSVAARCLTCANCTMVCPTCFCTTVEDVTDLAGNQAERWRKWDACFALDFSYIHGGSVRSSPKSRYRQWITHKLAAWVDQFGEIGCVGCGRCVTWCPAGIDITAEVRAIRDSEAAAGASARQEDA